MFKSRKFTLVILGVFCLVSLFVTTLIFAKDHLSVVGASIVGGIVTLISFYFGYNVKQKKILPFDDEIMYKGGKEKWFLF